MNTEEKERAVKTVRLRVEGMACQGCAENVSSALERVDGVRRVEVSLRDEEAIVLADGEVEPAGLVAAVERAGYGATAVGAA